MYRFAVIPLVGGVVLLVSWIAAPAAPRSADPALADVAALDQSATVVAEVNAQVDRLRKRLATAPDYPPPVRNPFRFSGRPEPRRAPARLPEPAPAEPPAPPLPALLAITATTVDGALVRAGVLRVQDAVQIVKPGDAIGSLVVRSVEADAIVFFDPATSKTYRVLLN